ncbi:MAG: acyltransferase [Subdoligranulum sp.]|nr:acyltransferase [Subdoligranulum sp.]
MLLMKIYCHGICALKKLLFKVLYRNKIKFGRGISFRSRFGLMIENTGQVEIGSRCFFNDDCSIACMGCVRIGEGTIFGANVRIYDHNHHFSDTKRPIKEQGYTVGEVNIGSHCWIASNVTLLKDCEIGDNCMIGAGCVISETIPDNTVVKLVQQKQYFDLRPNENE